MATKKTPEQWAEIIKTVHSTWKMANTLAKALAKRYSDRWQFIDFLGPAGHESAGVVDILAIRKSGKKPMIEGLKSLDLFDIILIQVKGGSAGMPNSEDVERLKKVKFHYSAQEIVLFEWNKSKSLTRFSVLDNGDVWTEKTSAEIFGKPDKSKKTAAPASSTMLLSTEPNAATKAWVTRRAKNQASSNDSSEPTSESKNDYSNWERTFRSDAQSDNCQVFRAHLERLELPDEPALLLEGTILFVRSCVAFLMMDGRPLGNFLTHQRYDPALVTDAPYLVTFDVCGRAYARITMPKSFIQLDFADLYDTPWEQYERVGYHQFWISRADKQDLNPDELSEFVDVITKDLRFDNAEEEVGFWFDTSLIDGVLFGCIYDVVQEEDDDVDDQILP